MTAISTFKNKMQEQEMTKVGYKSGIFPAKFKGGVCAISGIKIFKGDPVAYFGEFGLCHAAAIEGHLFKLKMGA